MHATVEAVLNFHAKPGAERLQGGAGRPNLGRPAGLGLCHLATDLLCMASDPSWTSVLRVSSSDSSILGWAARGWPGGLVPGLSVLRFTDIAHQRSTLPLD